MLILDIYSMIMIIHEFERNCIWSSRNSIQVVNCSAFLVSAISLNNSISE